MTVIQLADRLRDESDAYKFLEELRWPDGVAVCPHCDHQGATYIEPTNGKDRATRTGTRSQRRVWRCLGCRKQFSVITGTVMHGTKVPLRVWVLCFFEMCSSKNGVAAREIERKYGVCCRTAWHLMHRIREAMKNDSLVQTMRGRVVSDETFIGPNPKYMKNRVFDRGGTQRRRSTPHKTPVHALVDADTGEVRARVVPDVTGATLRKVLSEQVDMAASTLYTDEYQGYVLLGREFAAHETVNHRGGEYVRYSPAGFIGTNPAENFFSQLKRSIDGTHHRVSVEHLDRYLAEFAFRHSSNKITDEARLRKLMGRVGGKRLSYKRITAA